MSHSIPPLASEPKSVTTSSAFKIIPLALISIIALPVIAALGFLATLGVFTFAPDVLLIPSLVGLSAGGIALLVKLGFMAKNYLVQQPPLISDDQIEP
jgi:hypothetical protein